VLQQSFAQKVACREQRLLQSAKGAQCKSLGQRPRLTAEKLISAEGAELFGHEVCYALSALGLIELSNPGRCPGLSHFAPLAQRFKTGSMSHTFEKYFLCKALRQSREPSAAIRVR
jgi:hypothetical protein